MSYKKKKMIKGLYFKLNMERVGDRIIYNFFNSLDKDTSKITALSMLITSYLSQDEQIKLATMNLEKDGAYHD